MKINLWRNSAWAIIEVVATGLTLFFLYKFIVANLGVATLGVWSLVLAATSLVRLADVGGSAGLSRFVAQAVGQGKPEQSDYYIDSAFASNGVIYCAAALALYSPLSFGLAKVMPAESVAEAHSILPFALVSLVLMNLNFVFTAALIGYQRSDIKSAITISSYILQATLVVILVPDYGLVGVAWAQILQFAFALVISRLAYSYLRHGRLTNPLPRKFSRSAFKEVFGFGLRLQATNVMAFLFEPAIKFMLTATAGLAVLGIFEMAYRMVMQLRQLVVAPGLALVAAFAHLEQTDREARSTLYHQAFTTSAVFAVPLLIGVSICSPFVSIVWLGSLNGFFVAATCACAVGWLLNSIAASGYFLGVGAGITRWNFAGHAIGTIGGPLVGYGLFQWYGAAGATAGAMVTFGLGTVLSMIMNCRTVRVAPLPSRKVARRVIREFAMKLISIVLRRPLER